MLIVWFGSGNFGGNLIDGWMVPRVLVVKGDFQTTVQGKAFISCQD